MHINLQDGVSQKTLPQSDFEGSISNLQSQNMPLPAPKRPNVQTLPQQIGLSARLPAVPATDHQPKNIWKSGPMMGVYALAAISAITFGSIFGSQAEKK